MDIMSPLEGSRDEVVTRIRSRVEELDKTMADLMREALRENDTDIQVRVERAKKSVADKGSKLETMLEQAENVDESQWEETQETLRAAWVDYKEAVDRARLELERAEELS